jgi:2-methylcitrate dehydratase PrpD
VPARIEVSARGETYVAEVDDPVGGQTKPMRQPDIVRKFRANAAGRLPAEQVDRIAEASTSLGGLLTAVRAALTDASQQHQR